MVCIFTRNFLAALVSISQHLLKLLAHWNKPKGDADRVGAHRRCKSSGRSPGKCDMCHSHDKEIVVEALQRSMYQSPASNDRLTIERPVSSFSYGKLENQIEGRACPVAVNVASRQYAEHTKRITVNTQCFAHKYAPAQVSGCTTHTNPKHNKYQRGPARSTIPVLDMSTAPILIMLLPTTAIRLDSERREWKC